MVLQDLRWTGTCAPFCCRTWGTFVQGGTLKIRGWSDIKREAQQLLSAVSCASILLVVPKTIALLHYCPSPLDIDRGKFKQQSQPLVVFLRSFSSVGLQLWRSRLASANCGRRRLLERRAMACRRAPPQRGLFPCTHQAPSMKAGNRHSPA